jgi:hypothetical protein
MSATGATSIGNIEVAGDKPFGDAGGEGDCSDRGRLPEADVAEDADASSVLKISLSMIPRGCLWWGEMLFSIREQYVHEA